MGKYDVDVRPPAIAEKSGLVASAGRIAGMAFTMPSMRNLNAVTPTAGESTTADKVASESFKKNIAQIGAKRIAVAGYKANSEIEQLVKISPREEDDEALQVLKAKVQAETASNPKISEPSAQVGSVNAPAVPDLARPGEMPPPHPPEGGVGPGPRKPKVPTPRTSTLEFLDGLDCDEAERSISPDGDENDKPQQRGQQGLPGMMMPKRRLLCALDR